MDRTEETRYKAMAYAHAVMKTALQQERANTAELVRALRELMGCEHGGSVTCDHFQNARRVVQRVRATTSPAVPLSKEPAI